MVIFGLYLNNMGRRGKREVKMKWEKYGKTEKEKNEVLGPDFFIYACVYQKFLVILQQFLCTYT